MTTTTETRPLTHVGVDTRLKMSALWIAVLFVFAYVDLFSLYRPDVREQLEAGTLSAFDINQAFLFFTTLYIAIPSVMVYLTLVMRPNVNRLVNTIVPVLYGLTIVGAAVGEWTYFIFGSALEVVLLVGVAYHARTLR